MAGAAGTFLELSTRSWVFEFATLLFLTGYLVWLGRRYRGRTGLEITAEGAFTEGRLVLRRSRLHRAEIVREAERVTVSISVKRRFVRSVIEVSSVEEARELVKALGLDAQRALSALHFDSPLAIKIGPLEQLLSVWLAMPALALLHIIGLLDFRMALALACPLLVFVALQLVHTKVWIGIDGILVRWLWRRELFRFSDLRGVEPDGRRLHLVLSDGRRRTLSAWWAYWRGIRWRQQWLGVESAEVYVWAVAQRAHEAAAARGGQATPFVAALSRRGRDIETWRRELRALLRRGAPGFREAEAIPEELWAVVEDGAADPAARVAAAVALSPTLAAPDRQRLRDTARITVSPRLRIAIEAAADEDEAATSEALAELSDAEAARASRRIRRANTTTEDGETE